MSLINDFLFKQARKRGIELLVKELKEYQEKVSASESDTWLNVFNTGLYVNMKKAGENTLTTAIKILEKARKQVNKASNKQEKEV